MSGYGYYRAITVDHTKVPNTDRTNFPVLFSGTYAWLATVANGGLVQSSSGYDIIFALDALGQQRLPHELVTYTASSGLIVCWVTLPTISHTADTVFYVLYGNASISSDQSFTVQAWWRPADSPINLCAMHLDGGGADATGLQTGSSTAITYNTTNGKIYQGAGFNGSTSQIDISSVILSPAHLSVTAWVNPSSLANAYNAIETNFGPSKGHGFFVKSNGKLAVFLQRTGASVNYDGTGSNTLSTGTWYHVAFTYDGSTLIGYVNGAADATVSDASGYTSASANQVIGQDTQTAGHRWTGAIDEFRVWREAISADWIATEYNNQNSPSTFYSVESTDHVPTTGGVSAYAWVG